MTPSTLIVVSCLVLLGAAAAVAHRAVRKMRFSTGLPSPLAVLRRHPRARMKLRKGEKVASIPGQTEGLVFNELALACWDLMDGRRSLAAIAQRLARQSSLTSREALAEIRPFARSLKRALLAMEEEEWRLIHTHSLDLFAGCGGREILEHRPSESLIIHAARCILSPDGDFEPWRGTWGERRRAMRTMRRHDAREASMEKAGRLFRRGWKLIRRGVLQEAEDVLLKASRLAPNWANPHYQLGYIRLHLRRYDDAILSLERAEALHPGYFMVREYRDHAHRLRRGELDHRAFQLFDRANEAGLDNPDAIIRLAGMALEISPDFPSARLILARAYQKKHLLEEALGELSRTIQMDPDKATLCHVLLSRGSIFQAQGRLEEAVREWEKVLQINGSETATRSALATLAATSRVH